MTTAIDTNVLIALWNEEEKENRRAQAALDDAFSRGRLVVAAPVFSELMAFPARDEGFLLKFFADTGIVVDWDITEKVWRSTGHAFQRYLIRRKRSRAPAPRRILADFVIGAHAAVNGYTLLTLDRRFYEKDFPALKLIDLG